MTRRMTTSPPPRTRHRASGWTAERQAAFLEALAELGSVERAAACVGLSASSAFRLRKQPRGAAFAAEWDAALATREERLHDALMDRIAQRHAPAYYRGRIIGERVVASDRLLLRVLDRRLRRRPVRTAEEAVACYDAALTRLRGGLKFNESP